MVTEHLVSIAKTGGYGYFHPTTVGTKFDLLSNLPDNEVKFGHTTKLGKAYHHAIADLGLSCSYAVYSCGKNYILFGDAKVICIIDALSFKP